MFCTGCGGTIPDGARFCAACGATVDAAAVAPPTRTRPGVVTVLAVLKILSGTFWLGLTALWLLASADGDLVFRVLATLSFGMAAACAACAYGLWTLKPYGRLLQIALSCLGILIGFPLGSVVSILILVYLFQPGLRILFSGRPPESLSVEEAAHLRSAQTLGKTATIAVAAVVAVLIVPMTGIIAAIAIPNFLNAVDRGKQKRTMADVRTIGSAMDGYAREHDGYPVTDSASGLAVQLAPKYIPAMPLVDGWGHALQVHSTESGYTLYSFGKDGTGSSCEPGQTITFNDEICLTDGQFVRYPAGTER